MKKNHEIKKNTQVETTTNEIRLHSSDTLKNEFEKWEKK